MNVDKKIVLTASYLVKTKWNDWIEAEVCAKRHIDNDPNNAKEYFVHYKSYDRRFDEWVSLERINLHSYKDPYEDPDLALLKAELENIEQSSNNSKKNKLTRDQMRKRLNNKINNGEEISKDKKQEKTNSMSATLEKEFKEFTKIKYITEIQLGKYLMNTWYFSPYPNTFGKMPNIYVCPMCLTYYRDKPGYYEHVLECPVTTPLGKLLYTHSNLQLYEVDGEFLKLHAQCLCLLGKLFIDQKTIYYDVDSFLFYILYEVKTLNSQNSLRAQKIPLNKPKKNYNTKNPNTEKLNLSVPKKLTSNEIQKGPSTEYQIVGYFSKEKESEENNNLACIVVLPPFQRKGYGSLLIQISYELSKRQGVLGQPEKPLSFMGHLSYQAFWRWKILTILDRQYKISNRNASGSDQPASRKRLRRTSQKLSILEVESQSTKTEAIISIQDISLETSISKEDILNTLEELELLNIWLNDGHTVAIPSGILNQLISDSRVFKVPKITALSQNFI